MDLQIENKVAIVTGSSDGIGYAVAKRLLQEGCKVVISGRNQEKLARALKELERISPNVFSVAGDLTKKEYVDLLVQRTVEHFGTVHILINNVGGVGAFKPFEEIDDDEWMLLFEKNLFSTVRMIRAALPYMEKQHWGRIIAISSESAVQPDPVIPHYNAAKAALNAFMKSLSKAHGKDGILINTVSPAFILTEEIRLLIKKKAEHTGKKEEEVIQEFLKEYRPSIELGRPGMPEEVGDVVAFIVSGAFMTGSNVRVDGGSVKTV